MIPLTAVFPGIKKRYMALTQTVASGLGVLLQRPTTIASKIVGQWLIVSTELGQVYRKLA